MDGSTSVYSMAYSLLKPTVETNCSEKKTPFKTLLLADNVPSHLPSHPRAVRELYNEINTVFTPANTAPVLQPVDQGVILTFSLIIQQTHSIRPVIPLLGSGQSKLKSFWKEFTILDASKNVCGSWEDVKTSTLTGI